LRSSVDTVLDTRGLKCQEKVATCILHDCHDSDYGDDDGEGDGEDDGDGDEEDGDEDEDDDDDNVDGDGGGDDGEGDGEDDGEEDDGEDDGRYQYCFSIWPEWYIEKYVLKLFVCYMTWVVHRKHKYSRCFLLYEPLWFDRLHVGRDQSLVDRL